MSILDYLSMVLIGQDIREAFNKKKKTSLKWLTVAIFLKWQSWIIFVYHGLSWNGLSWTIMDYHGHHGLSWTIVNYCGLSWTI